jgi:hypothetical protein
MYAQLQSRCGASADALTVAAALATGGASTKTLSVFVPVAWRRCRETEPAGHTFKAAEAGQWSTSRPTKCGQDVASGVKLLFAQYLARRLEDPAFGFQEHLRMIGGAIEE